MKIGIIAWPVLREMAVMVYDHMGVTILTSAVWLAMAGLPALFARASVLALGPLGYLVGALALAAMAFPATAAVFAMVARVRRREEAGIRVFWQAFRRYFFRAAGLGLLNFLFWLVLGGDLFFALRSHSLFFQLLGGIWVWMAVFLLVMTIYYFPLMVEQENGVWAIMKKAALLTLDNPLNSLLIFLEAVLVFFLCLVLPPLLVLALGGAEAALGLAAFTRIMQKYEENRLDTDA